MAALALLLLGLGLVVMVRTGWPSYAVLLAVACAVAALAVASGTVQPVQLMSLSTRLVGLLEHDLLQAVALYALVGALLRHVDLAGRVYEAARRVLSALGLRRLPGHALAGFFVGGLVAPLNGSVAASAHVMAHAVVPRWRAAGMSAGSSTGLAAASATLGSIVPPSLVLLLLGDAMMRAHIEGLTRSGVSDVRVMNTQDLVQACAPVALLLAAGWAAVAVWRTRRANSPDVAAAPAEAAAAAAATEEAARPGLAGWIAPLIVAVLMTLVAIGTVRAVEAAALAALALLGYAAWSGTLAGGGLGRLLDDAMTLTGALFALLLAASTLSLVLRAVGCDRLVEDGLARLAGHPAAATAAVLAGMLLLAFVLDAFEIVFLVVPLVMPALLAQVSDAAWVACLTMLVLQAGFLLPPFGYAVVVSRALAGPGAVPAGQMAREVRGYLAVLAGVLALVASVPGITHWLRTAPERIEKADPAAADDLLRSMSAPRERGASSP